MSTLRLLWEKVSDFHVTSVVGVLEMSMPRPLWEEYFMLFAVDEAKHHSRLLSEQKIYCIAVTVAIDIAVGIVGEPRFWRKIKKKDNHWHTYKNVNQISRSNKYLFGLDANLHEMC